MGAVVRGDLYQQCRPRDLKNRPQGAPGYPLDLCPLLRPVVSELPEHLLPTGHCKRISGVESSDPKMIMIVRVIVMIIVMMIRIIIVTIILVIIILVVVVIIIVTSLHHMIV